MNQESSKYHMTLSLNVLEHLGLNLYSSLPAVISEIVANSYDADASRVDIKWRPDQDIIEIFDDGMGMTQNDINQRFLVVGYKKRTDQTTTPKGRKPMGRKGIGKLSVFSIAKTIQIYTAKKDQKHAFEMSFDEIQKKIEVNHQNQQYEPMPIDASSIDFKSGTKIVLSNLRSKHKKTDQYIKTQIARRFSVLGDDFQVFVNDAKIEPKDRGYHNSIQFLWAYSKDKQASIVTLCKNKEHHENRYDSMNEDEDLIVTGWIGSVKKSGQIKDSQDKENLNRIAIFMRGKMAQNDLLKDFNEHGVYASYLIGELHVEGLDDDQQPDSAASNRQGIQENDPRYIKLKNRLQKELNYIQSQWSIHRTEAGAKQAQEMPAIKDWIQSKKGDTKKRAERWLGKINTLKVEPKMKKELYKHAVLAHEHFEVKQKLSALEEIDASNLEVVLDIFKNFDELEHSLYGEIVKQRLGILKEIEEKINQNDYEKVIQQYLFDHLWLLDPHWERATKMKETTIEKAFNTINNELTEDQKNGRLDLGYRSVAGKYVIVELKRPDVEITTSVSKEQIKKYKYAMSKVLKQQSPDKLFDIECILLIGCEPKDWKDGPEAKKDALNECRVNDIRIVFYEQLITEAKTRYECYLESQENVNKIQGILEAIENFAE